MKPSSPEELGELLEKMTPEQLDQLKAQLRKMEEQEAPEPEAGSGDLNE